MERICGWNAFSQCPLYVTSLVSAFTKIPMISKRGVFSVRWYFTYALAAANILRFLFSSTYSSGVFSPNVVVRALTSAKTISLLLSAIRSTSRCPMRQLCAMTLKPFFSSILAASASPMIPMGSVTNAIISIAPYALRLTAEG